MADAGPPPIQRRGRRAKPVRTIDQSTFRPVAKIPESVEYHIGPKSFSAPPFAVVCDELPRSFIDRYAGGSMSITIFRPPHPAAQPTHPMIFVETDLEAPFHRFELVNRALRDHALQWAAVHPQVIWAALHSMICAAKAASEQATEETLQMVRSGIADRTIKIKTSKSLGRHARIYASKPTLHVRETPDGFEPVILVRQGQVTIELARGECCADLESATAEGRTLLDSELVATRFAYRHKRPERL